MQTSVERKGKKSTGLNWYTLGPLLAAVAVAALMYLLAVMLERQILPYALVDELLIACVFLGAAIGGAAAAIKRGRSALASGLIAGAVLAARLADGRGRGCSVRRLPAPCNSRGCRRPLRRGAVPQQESGKTQKARAQKIR